LKEKKVKIFGVLEMVFRFKPLRKIKTAFEGVARVVKNPRELLGLKLKSRGVLVGAKKPATSFSAPLVSDLVPLFDASRSKITLKQFDGTWNLRRHSFVEGGKGVKGLIVEATCESSPFEKRWVFYPKKEDLEIFMKAARFVKGGGPAQTFVAAVGSVQVVVNPRNEWFIEHIQSHFIQGVPVELTRGVATKYGGWRHRVLDAIFKQALVEKTPPNSIYFISHLITERWRDEDPMGHTSALNQKKVFEKVAEDNGFLVTTNLLDFPNGKVFQCVAKKI
jgi:hypothetical protein